MQIDSYIPITKAKSQFLNMIRSFDKNEDTIAITKNGIPKAVIISMEQYESICETIEIMSSKDIMQQIRASMKEIQEKKSLHDLENIV
jgi:antitoxin YefM